MGLLPDSYLAQPLLHVKGRTGLARVQLMVSHDAYLGETAVEIQDVTFQSLALGSRPRILGLHPDVAATHVHDVAAYAVETCGTVGYLPWIDVGVLVVVHQPFHASVNVHHIRVTHLLPATSTLAYRVGVPVTYLRRAYRTAFRRGGAVDYKVLHRLTHLLQGLGSAPAPVLLYRYQDFRPYHHYPRPAVRRLPLCRGYMQG